MKSLINRRFAQRLILVNGPMQPLTKLITIGRLLAMRTPLHIRLLPSARATLQHGSSLLVQALAQPLPIQTTRDHKLRRRARADRLLGQYGHHLPEQRTLLVRELTQALAQKLLLEHPMPELLDVAAMLILILDLLFGNQ